MASRIGAVSDQEIIHGLPDELPVGLSVARAPNGEQVYANGMFADILGEGRYDIHSRDDTPYSLLTRDGKPYPKDRLPFVRALAERRLVVVDDIAIHRRDGTKVDVRAFGRPVSDSTGEVTHVVVAWFDITREVAAERARAATEEELHRARRIEAIGTLAGGIAHDFNNLVFGIKLIAADLAASAHDAKTVEALKMIDEITERSATLTRSLLAFARRGKHHASPVRLDHVLGDMSDLLARTLTGVTIEFDLRAGDDGIVVGDRSQLEQVVMNLMVNARDALTDGGRVQVRSRTHDQSVVFEVADDGPGIPLEYRDRVFEPYFTTKTQSADRGTGLGLATVLGIVEGHGGTIEIDGGLSGRGTTFRIALPAAAAERPRSSAGRSTKLDRQLGWGTVLIVDDDPIVLRALSAAVETLGYTAIRAPNGAHAVEVLRERTDEIRAVVLDMVMPHMSGRATYSALRNIRPDIAVIAMSGHAMSDEIDALLELGVRSFIAKPYSIEKLASSLADVVSHPELALSLPDAIGKADRSADLAQHRPSQGA
jgi:signal transduction histidine kinase/ActR/RegA family two-component response regulator